MIKKGKILLFRGIVFILLFVVWTVLIQIVDVRPIGQNNTLIGFATINSIFHKFTGVHMELYIITDWLGLVPIFVCILFAGLGLSQLIKRRSILKVDCDILILGVYYIIIICCYIMFEMYPINYRPILINCVREASYPSSTTLLVLCVMPTCIMQVLYRVKSIKVRRILNILSMCFSIFMVLARLYSGVHWFTDIVGAIFFAIGVVYMYKAFVILCSKEKNILED